MTEIRTRFAPSPTGKLHIGGARTALFNWAVARRHGGRFLLRIEDTDRERSLAEHETAILQGLAWLGIDWDEGPEKGGDCGPYRQSERVERHLELARGLLDAGHAYRCFCTPERLAELREAQQAAKETPGYDRRCRELSRADSDARAAAGEPFALRFAVPDGETTFDDQVRGTVTFQNREVDDWIMLRRDGSPTYNFVVVCDDADMRISHVLRGEEHLVNTPKQVLLYRALELEPPTFGHLPLMLGTDGKKMSKRTGDTALLDYREKGYPKEAIVNFLCLQGWALDGETEVFSLDELVANFDIGDVSKAGSIFDLDKFAWLAGEYIRASDVPALAERCRPFVVEAGLMDEAELAEREDWFHRVVAAEQERIHLYTDLPGRIAYLFAADDAVVFEEKAEKNARKQGTDVLSEYRGWLANELEGGFEPDALRDATKAWMKERELKFPPLFQPLRCALSGMGGGPDLFEIMDLLGAERTLARIDAARTRLAAD